VCNRQFCPDAAETVLRTDLLPTATATGRAIGELFGTLTAPRIPGSLGNMYGLRIIFLIASTARLSSFFITFGLTEILGVKSGKSRSQNSAE
jgi:hypothetical protein